jgi:tetratricopeptide (TPR) repeat protein
MMKSPLVIATLMAVGAIAQTPMWAVEEPPEFTGAAFPALSKPSATLTEFGQVIEGSGKDFDSPEGARRRQAQLNGFIERHPGTPDGYYFRAILGLQILKSRDYPAILADIDKAMSLGPPELKGAYSPDEIYPMRAKVHYQMGHYQQAVDDLETAIKRNIDDADSIFGCSDTKPDGPNDLWRLEEVNSLVERFPNDYRTWLMRGLYWKFFTRFSTDRQKDYPEAFREFQKASLVNPRSALAHFFLGGLHTRMSFWTKEVWSELDHKQRDQDNRKAAFEYGKAIELDPTFREAYLNRATAHYSRKEFALAIPDYDKVLALDPNNQTALNDRGLANLEMGRSLAAVEDLSRVIELKTRKAQAMGDPDGIYLQASYESRADAYAKMGEYQKVIADLTEVLRLRLRGHMLLLNMRQFRGLYPEYDGFSDKALRVKLGALFWPQRQWETDILRDFSGEKNEWAIGQDWKELFEKRGNAYLQTAQFPLALKDFRRIQGLPRQYAGAPAEKWQPLYLTLQDHYSFLNIETAAQSSDEWTLAVKTTDKGSDSHPLYQIHTYNLDCRTAYVQETSRLTYDEDDNVVPNAPDPFGIGRTIGQQLYQKTCHR